MATLRPAAGSPRKVRCSRCSWVWQAELSYPEKLMVAADAMLPVRRTMLAAAQAATDAARSTLPPLRRPTMILADELAAASVHANPVPVAAPGLGGNGGARSWPLFWRLFWQPSLAPRWRLSSLLNWRPSPSRLQWLVIGLALVDASVIAGRIDVVWVMPQTAPFYAALGMPVSLRGVQFERLTAAAEQHRGEPVLIVKGQIGNSTDKPETVPHLRFAILNAERQEIYSWTAAPGRGRRLPAGETLGFESELVLPPPDTRAVTVRFVDPDNAL